MSPSTRTVLLAGFVAGLLALLLPVDIGVPAVAFGAVVGGAVWIVARVTSYRRRRREAYTVDGDPEIERLQVAAARVCVDDASLTSLVERLYSHLGAVEQSVEKVRALALEDRIAGGGEVAVLRAALFGLSDVATAARDDLPLIQLGGKG